MAKFGSYEGDDRRRHSRVNASFVVTYRLGKPLEVSFVIEKRQVTALMIDLSQEGMALLTAYNMPEATVLFINFTLINMSASNEEDKIKTMDLIAEVRYSRPAPKNEYRLGISFSRISKEDGQTISDFVRTAK